MFAIVPLSVNAEDLSLAKQYKPKDISMVIETGTYLIGYNSFRGDSKYSTQKDNTFILMGANQNLSVGIDIKGMQISVDAMYQKYKPSVTSGYDTKRQYSFGISLDVPLLNTSFTPIVSGGCGLVGINWQSSPSSALEYEIDEMAFNFIVGFGARYYVNEHIFFKTLLTYQRYAFDTNIQNPQSYENVKIDFKNQSVGLTFSMGYRF